MKVANPEFRSEASSPRERSLEQDRAAGGRARRRVSLNDRRDGLASVALLQHHHAVFAYLRFTEDSKTVTRYIGPVKGRTRDAALREAWRAARSSGLLS